MNELSSGQGRTVLFVSHQIPAVTALCNKGIFLEKGIILENGDLNKCVDLYFNSNLNQKNALWENGINNEYIYFSSAKLTNNTTNEIKCEYKKGEIVILEINYEIKQTGNQYVFAIDIYAMARIKRKIS